MFKLAGNTRAALLGVLFAVVAFSYALATGGRGFGDDSATAAAREVRTAGTLDFTNPYLDDTNKSLGRDLGDAVIAGSFLRYCRATGGVPPYKFVGSNDTASAKALSDLGLAVALNGSVSSGLGVVKNVVGSIFTFKVSVFDSASTNLSAKSPGNSAMEPFNITLYPEGTTKFAVGPDLGNAVQNQSFQTVLAVLAGSKAVLKFTLVDNSVALDGVNTAVKKLADAGLFLDTASGVLFGKPCVFGKLTFKVTCTADGAPVKNRDGGSDPQSFILDITKNVIVTGDVVATSAAVKGGAAGKDSVKYAAVANIQGLSVANATGTISLTIGGFSKSAKLESKGKTEKANKDFKGSISSKGQIKVSVAKQNLTKTMFTADGVIADKASYLVPVSVNVGDTISGIETLIFSAKEKSGKFSLAFKLGAGSPGGTFLVTSATGKDDTKKKSGDVADAWKIGFIGQKATGSTFPGKTKQSFGAAQAFVNIGAGFSDTFAMTGKDKSDKISKGDNKVLKLSMDATKGKGSVQTSNVFGLGAKNAKNTGIPLAGSGGVASANLAFGVALGDANITSASAAKYAGQSSIVIFAGKNSWTDKHK